MQKRVLILLILLAACAKAPIQEVVVQQPIIQEPIDVTKEMASLRTQILDLLGSENVRLNEANEYVKALEQFKGYTPSIAESICKNNEVTRRKQKLSELTIKLEGLVLKNPQNPEFVYSNCVLTKQSIYYFSLYSIEEQICRMNSREMSKWEDKMLEETVPNIIWGVYNKCAEYKNN